MTLAEALAAFRSANSLPRGEEQCDFWTCRVGPLTLRLPNFSWRRRALLAHDLHHVLTDTPCTMFGECRMAAWEIGAGPMPHWGAGLMCAPLALAGLILIPRQTAAAFRAGRRSRSLHGAPVPDHVLMLPVEQARRALRR